jgi:hypothetical protein
LIYGDILDSRGGAYTWRNIPKYENIINSGDGLQLLNIGIRCRWNNGTFDRVRQSFKYDQVSFETYNTQA